MPDLGSEQDQIVTRAPAVKVARSGRKIQAAQFSLPEFRARGASGIMKIGRSGDQF